MKIKMLSLLAAAIVLIGVQSSKAALRVQPPKLAAACSVKFFGIPLGRYQAYNEIDCNCIYARGIGFPSLTLREKFNLCTDVEAVDKEKPQEQRPSAFRSGQGERNL